MLNSTKAGARSGGMDGFLYFVEPSMNRLNQTETATFSILSFWSFVRDYVSLLQCLIYYLLQFTSQERIVRNQPFILNFCFCLIGENSPQVNN
jgi:hypothetical protein